MLPENVKAAVSPDLHDHPIVSAFDWRSILAQFEKAAIGILISVLTGALLNPTPPTPPTPPAS